MVDEQFTRGNISQNSSGKLGAEQFPLRNNSERTYKPEIQIARAKSFIVKSNIRDSSELSISEEFLEAMDKKVEQLLREAEERSKANSRRTVLARDL